VKGETAPAGSLPPVKGWFAAKPGRNGDADS
jgi:hypothetical protein